MVGFLDELLKIEKERGYKRGWATRIFKLREDRMIDNSVKFETPTIFDVVETLEVIDDELE